MPSRSTYCALDAQVVCTNGSCLVLLPDGAMILFFVSVADEEYGIQPAKRTPMGRALPKVISFEVQIYTHLNIYLIFCR